MTVRTGGGDPASTLALLWRNQPQLGASRRGPKRRLSVDQIVATASARADASGLTGLSMRRLATDLGVTAMTLYTYVPGKSELLDLMTDAAYAELPQNPVAGDTWRERLATVARDNLDLYRRHQWLAEMVTSRPQLGPHLMAKYDRELQAMADTGLDDLDLDSVLTLLLDFVHSAARKLHEQSTSMQQTGLDDEQWWAANEPLLRTVFDATRFPTAVRVGSVAGEKHRGAYDAGYAFEFGLGRLLDGVAALVGHA